MHKHTAKISAALLMVCVAGANSIFDQAFAKAPVKKARTAHTAPVSTAGGTVQSADGTTITRNADGSVDVTDGGGSAPVAQSGGGAVTTGSQKVIARQVRSGNTHYSDGVTVKRNSDGSVEVSDPPTIERWGSQAAPATSHRSTGTKKRKHK
jgi:hypothetical protein